MQQSISNNLKEGLDLARKWKNIAIGYRLLRENDIELWREPTHTIDTPFFWRIDDEDFDVLVYDGGAISTDGTLVVQFPKISSILTMPEDIKSFIDSESKRLGGYDMIKNLPIDYILKPFSIFYNCMNNYWTHKDFEILVDIG